MTEIAVERVGPEASLLRPGRTCWRIERASRMALIIDAADYFRLARQAMTRARHSILLIGWDFDLRICLTPDEVEDDYPIELGAFLKALVRRNRALDIHILKWDMAAIYTITRQAFPFLFLEVVGRRRVHFRLDATHPAAAAHHQKIVVIDDALAFCGGIDMTDNRWDTREHPPQDKRRCNPGGEPFGPWHDATAAVDGAAAKALGELSRQRWRAATGKAIPVPPEVADLWPDELEPIFRDVDVGIARTMPAYGKREQIVEIERLYKSAIAAAGKSIYIESQYFASRALCEAMCARLEEPGGPEIVIVNPESAEGWLEEAVMGAARDVALERIAEADRFGRFRIYWPANSSGEPIYVHAKIMIVDDRFLRIGSSNLNNRSMGFDTECDLAVEADGAADPVATRRHILQIRNGLVAEHLGVGQDEIEQAVGRHGCLRDAIDGLRRPDGRTLRVLERGSVNDAERAIVESGVADPERPARAESRFNYMVKRLLFGARRGLD